MTRTVRGYEELGVSAIFIEDQKSPVSCGQMGKKDVVPVKEMCGNVKAALPARKSADTFILARTAGRSAANVTEAIQRGEAYRDAGADGLYVEGLRSASELKFSKGCSRGREIRSDTLSVRAAVLSTHARNPNSAARRGPTRRVSHFLSR